MIKKSIVVILPILIIGALVLAACNFPGVGNGGTSNEAQIQTMAAATVAAQLNAYMTQTAQAGQVIIVTATPEALPTATQQPLATATTKPTAVPPTATPKPCNQASFVDDISVPDGTKMTASQPFTKTWSITNVGTCTWTTSYVVYFDSGNSMSGAATYNFPNSVAPGQTVEISVPLVAPSSTGDYTGSWKFRAPNGDQFGVGANGGVPVTVVIKVVTVPTPKDPNTVYDFIKNFCDAQWRTNAGTISCPSQGVDFKNGAIMRTYSPILESGTKDDEGALVTVPAAGGDGMIRGQYPAFKVHAGDHIAGTLLCSGDYSKCDVTFEILAEEKGTDTKVSLGTWAKKLDHSVLPIDIDLTAYDGKSMIFYLKVSSNGNSSGDVAQWMAIRITHP